MYNYCVIGAGVIGGMVARELEKYDRSVVIVEKAGDVAMGATRANSAIVHAGFDAHEGSLKARFNVRGSVMMESVAKELGVKYQRNGSLVVGFSDEDKKTLEELLERGKKNGVRELRLLDREEILAIEPNIGDGVTCALFAPTGAIICPYELCMASVGNAMDNGAELCLNFEVSAIEKTETGYKLTAADGRTVEAKTVINCAGVYSDAVAAMAGDTSFTVIPRRGEYMLLDRECGSLISHTVFRCPSKMGKGILVSPTVDGNLLLGPTAENLEDKEDTATTAKGISLVRTQAGEQVKNINFGKVITSFAGLRSVGSTGDFIINEKDGFINCAAIESPGLSSSPAIAEYVVELIRKAGETLTPRKDFIGKRAPLHAFREMTEEQKSEVIKKDPAYAHVICRCETVSEGEIRAAIRQNPKPHDIDGIKRRTRATMGRCQGGFCTPYLVRILAEELGVPETAITKFGGNSYLNLGLTKNRK
ncbi:MAG: NAD(P)/FAD-dependent oxidoreductase [Clostridia bacterium]|nr:NAD(P)/FAD-dependent oxidoreductase [Clostridia bacterium]